MIWEIEIRAIGNDAERSRVEEDFTLLTGAPAKPSVQFSSRGYLLQGDVLSAQARTLITDLLVDALVETGEVEPVESKSFGSCVITVLLKPGVMNPVALSVIDAAKDLGISLDSVHTFRRYYFDRPPELEHADWAWGKVLANDAIEHIARGPLNLGQLGLGSVYEFQRITVPLRELTDEGLQEVSRQGQLALSTVEMQTVQAHFRELGRDPTDVELETIAQTWSEHCSHKTLRGGIDFRHEGAPERLASHRYYDNLLKQTIFAATKAIRRRLGSADWCVSVFEDNAGVVKFDDHHHVCFKVETHNHPSAIEPYGGANTGLGGVIRDALGTGLGAKPICNTDIFCFAPPDWREELPPGVLHPRKVMKGVVAGVRDYGNRMGIPTVNGAVCFDERYLANPLVFCGTVGLIPVDRAVKKTHDGDLIVAVGGRTGRDGIHGATFSSLELTAESEKVSGGAVQIGNPITQKKLLDVILQARDRGLYHAITDCGAGGFSSAIGEMGAELGAVVHLERAPLKYDGLSYTEIWISESQERMILAVPPDSWSSLQALCAGEDVEAAVLGHFEDSGRLRLYYQEQQVADLQMRFLHHARPSVVRRAIAPAAEERMKPGQRPSSVRHGTRQGENFSDALLRILASYNVCSKEWIVRQYDHEVQGGSTVKPLVGRHNDGPGDAAVVAPVLGSHAGVAVGCGINPRYGDLDAYAMAAAAVDEAVRNVVAVGADPSRIALLDNFCWGNTDRPEILGSLVLAAQACHDVAVAYGTPFISGKDSLNNEYHFGERHLTIPPTLLISALGLVPDVRQCVSMDLKEAGNLLYLIGETKDELGGSHFYLVNGLNGGAVPSVDVEGAPGIFQALHKAIRTGLVRACHDLSEGGLAVALAEMCLAGDLGAQIDCSALTTNELDYVALLFAESNTRFVAEVLPQNAAAFSSLFSRTNRHCTQIGVVVESPRLQVAGSEPEAPAISLSIPEIWEAWRKPLRW
jgi:phosphoribosylformylglycinamidine synthase